MAITFPDAPHHPELDISDLSGEGKFVNLEELASVGGIVVPIFIAIGSISAKKASGGPRATRRSKRLLGQATELEAQSKNTSFLVQGASSLHRDALLREMARAQYPYTGVYLVLFIGIVYMGIGISQLIADPTEPWVLLGTGIFATFVGGPLLFALTASERRRVFYTGSTPSPLLTPAQTRRQIFMRTKFFEKAKIRRIRGRAFRNALSRLRPPTRSKANAD